MPERDAVEQGGSKPAPDTRPLSGVMPDASLAAGAVGGPGGPGDAGDDSLATAAKLYKEHAQDSTPRPAGCRSARYPRY